MSHLCLTCLQPAVFSAHTPLPIKTAAAASKALKLPSRSRAQAANVESPAHRSALLHESEEL